MLGTQAMWWILSHNWILGKSNLEYWALLLFFIFVLLCFSNTVSTLLIIIGPSICLDSLYDCLLGSYHINKEKLSVFLKAWKVHWGSAGNQPSRLKSTESFPRAVREHIAENPGKTWGSKTWVEPAIHPFKIPNLKQPLWITQSHI